MKLLILTTKNCPYCVKLKNEFNLPDIIVPTHWKEITDLERIKYNTKIVPTGILFSDDGREVAKFEGLSELLDYKEIAKEVRNQSLYKNM
jgi:glutaredoxin